MGNSDEQPSMLKGEGAPGAVGSRGEWCLQEVGRGKDSRRGAGQLWRWEAGPVHGPVKGPVGKQTPRKIVTRTAADP